MHAPRQQDDPRAGEAPDHVLHHVEGHQPEASPPERGVGTGGEQDPRTLRDGERPEREREVLRLRYGLGLDRELTLGEIGRRLSLSRERVRQIEAKALAKIRAARAA